MAYTAKDLALSYRKIHDRGANPGFRETFVKPRFPGNQKDAALAAAYHRPSPQDEAYAAAVAQQKRQRARAHAPTQQGLARPTRQRVRLERRAVLHAAVAELMGTHQARHGAATPAAESLRTSRASAASDAGSETVLLAKDEPTRRLPTPPPSLMQIARRVGYAVQSWLTGFRQALAKRLGART